MRFKKKLRACALCLLCSLFLIPLLSVPTTASTSESPVPSMENAASVWFSHLESDRLVASKDVDVNVGAGSSVKVMSGLLLCGIITSEC